MITDLMIHYTSPLWLLSTALELGLLVLFLRPLERRRDNLTRSFALLAVLAVLWHGNHLLHFDFAFDFLVNIALVTGFIALVGRTRRGQALYLACVFLLCTEIGKIVAVDVLLTEKRRQCLGAGIRPTFFVDGSRLGFINDFDLCTLIGNAADNAIEATSQLPLGEARESSWCPCRPRLESARGSELPRALPLEARVHLMARRVVGGGGGERGLLGCRSLRPINFTPSSCRSRLKKARHFALIRVRRSPAATGGCLT